MNFSRLFEQKIFGMVVALLACSAMGGIAVGKDITIKNKGENPILVHFQYCMKNREDVADYVIGLTLNKGTHVDYERKNAAGNVLGYLKRIVIFGLSSAADGYALQSAFVLGYDHPGKEVTLRVEFDSINSLLRTRENEESEARHVPVLCGHEAWDTFSSVLHQEGDDVRLFDFDVVGWTCLNCQLQALNSSLAKP